MNSGIVVAVNVGKDDDGRDYGTPVKQKSQVVLRI
jgi:hypothetical protein